MRPVIKTLRMQAFARDFNAKLREMDQNSEMAADFKKMQETAPLAKEPVRMNYRPVFNGDDAVRDMSNAPRDGTAVILKLRDDLVALTGREDLKPWEGVRFVGFWSGSDMTRWMFAAPVGQGGFPDEWMEGWVKCP